MSWVTLKVNRAEGLQPDARRPDNPVIVKDGRKLTIWPTKLVFAPLVADTVLQYLEDLNIQPGEASERLSLAAAVVGDYPWDEAKWFRGNQIT